MSQSPTKSILPAASGTITRDEVAAERNPILAEIYHRLRQPAENSVLLSKSLHARPSKHFTRAEYK